MRMVAQVDVEIEVELGVAQLDERPCCPDAGVLTTHTIAVRRMARGSLTSA
jgi:hypothetical protein